MLSLSRWASCCGRGLSHGQIPPRRHPLLSIPRTFSRHNIISCSNNTTHVPLTTRFYSMSSAEGQQQTEWSAVKVRDTFLDYFKKNGHTFGTVKDLFALCPSCPSLGPSSPLSLAASAPLYRHLPLLLRPFRCLLFSLFDMPTDNGEKCLLHPSFRCRIRRCSSPTQA